MFICWYGSTNIFKYFSVYVSLSVFLSLPPICLLDPESKKREQVLDLFSESVDLEMKLGGERGLSVGLAKNCLWFLSKNKRHIFHFHQELYWTMYSPSYSTTFCHFSGNLIIPSSQNLSFWAKNCSRCLLQSSRELKYFPLREFCKDQNKWKSEGTMSGEYSRWIRTSQPRCNSFCLVIKETCALLLTWWKIMHFLLTNSGLFSLSAAFSWSNWEQYLLELIVWFSGRSS